MLYRIDDIEIDTEHFEVRRGGKRQHVEPLVFDMLAYLAADAGNVVSKDEIFEQIWRGRIVSDATLSSCIKSARKALGDSGSNQKYIRTIRGRGFQFAGEVRQAGNEYDASQALAPETITKPSGYKNGAEYRESLIILPLQIFETNSKLEPLADGLVESLTTILTRVPLLAIVSRAASFALKGQTINPNTIGEQYRAALMLEGSLQQSSGKIRANVQLIETRNGFHLWAQQFECEPGPQAADELLNAILPVLEPQIVRGLHLATGDSGGELSARQMLFRAISVLSLKGWHRDAFEEAIGLLRDSAQKQPDIAMTHAYLALVLGLGSRVGLFSQSEEVVSTTVREAELALDLDNLDSNILGLAGCAFCDIGKVDRGMPLLKKAIAINGNNGQAWAALGSAYLITGDVDKAIEHLQEGLRVSPADNRRSVWGALLAIGYLQCKNLEKAMAAAETACQGDDKNYLPRVVLTAIHVVQGDRENSENSENSEKSYKECLRVKPDLSKDEISGLVGRKLAAAIESLQAQNAIS